MNKYVLALGSNQGDRLQHLIKAHRSLNGLGRIVATAPLTENPPWLPSGAPTEWFHFFYNTAVILETELSPRELLKNTQRLEVESGRLKEHATWSPRSLDIDIILELNGLTWKDDLLTLPHPEYKKRNFVLAPLLHLASHFNESLYLDILSAYRKLPQKLPFLMTILNVTPDSFSNTEEDRKNIHQNLEEAFSSGTSYLDIGAESTRPGATALSDEEEWERLKPVLEHTRDLKKQNPFIKVSLDTYHPATARKALDYGVDVLNDVSGFRNPALREVLPHFESVIAMHSLTIPADKKITWPEGTDGVSEIKKWIKEIEKTLPLQKLIWDPGLGFGKTPLQSMTLLKRFSEFQDLPLRSMVGHSRKSFMNLWTDKNFHERDPETLAASASLLDAGADILRVHNVAAHREFFRTHTSLASFGDKL